MIMKVFKNYRVQNMFKIWFSILSIFMTVGRSVGGSVGKWSVGLWVSGK